MRPNIAQFHGGEICQHLSVFNGKIGVIITQWEVSGFHDLTSSGRAGAAMDYKLEVLAGAE